MTRYALMAALAALCGALGWLMLQSRTIATLEADNASLTRSVAALTRGAEQSAAALSAAADLAEDQRRRALAFEMQRDNVLTKQYGGCADAAIDPDLLRDIGRMRLVPAPR